MCGIAFLLTKNNNIDQKATITRMMDSITHRGPDDAGHQIIDNIALGFRRLAILDLTSAGHQPMWDDTNRYAIIFNGEIYNYIELRSTLEKAGFHFKSNSDTEVLLKSYIHWGDNCLERLNGMFAFLIYDIENKELFGARDRFGIKPMYIYQNNEVIIIASEIKALLATQSVEFNVNWTVAAKYLFHGILEDSNETFYSDINKIPAGSAFKIETNTAQIRQWQYWSLQKKEIDQRRLADDYYDLFKDSIRLRLRSDVPVGVFLSGGMDSTAIICEMKRQLETDINGNSLHAYSFISSQYDEKEYIMKTIEYTKANVSYLESNPIELWQNFENALRFHDEPMHSITALVGYELMRMASNDGVKVILNGQGADEILAGYPNYFKNYWVSLYKAFNWKTLILETTEYAKQTGENPSNLIMETVLKSLKTQIRGFPLYKAIAINKSKTKAAEDPWYGPELKALFKPQAEYFHDETLSGTLNYSVTNYPLPLYLRIEDRNSMAHSVEARLPFMDYRLAELGYSVPDEQKMKFPWNKYVLRNAMINKIPENVRTRQDKMGFPTPIDDWIRNQLREPFLDIINSNSLKENGLFSTKHIKSELDKHMQNKTNVGSRLFRIVQFQTWLNIVG